MTDIDTTGTEGEPPPRRIDRAAPGGCDGDARHPAQRLRRALLATSSAGPGAPGMAETLEPESGSEASEPELEPRTAGRPRITRRALVTGVTLAALVGAAVTTLALSAVSSHSETAGPTPAPLADTLASPPPLRPSARDDAAMAYDPATGDVILYGGLVIGNQALTTLADTWSWDGARWSELHPAVSPPALSGAFLGYDPSTRDLVLTGGDTSVQGGHLADTDATWTWDGSSWSPQPEGGIPASDLINAVATDDATGQLILVTTRAGCEGTDTWRWGGTAWLLLHPSASPPPADSDGLAYDPSSASLDLFTARGGCDGTQEAAATTPPVFSWNGSTWTPGPTPTGSVLSGSWEATTSGSGDLVVTAQGTYRWGGEAGGWNHVSSSPAVGDSAIAYDEADRQVVLFGGMCSACGAAAVPFTWTWDGTWTLRDTTAATPRPTP
jgi:hypothetical protein